MDFASKVNLFLSNTFGAGVVTCTLRVYLGAVELWSASPFVEFGGGSEVEMSLPFELMAKNGSQSQEFFSGTEFNAFYNGAATEDGTQPLLLRMTAQLSSAPAGAYVLHRRSIVELL